MGPSSLKKTISVLTFVFIAFGCLPLVFAGENSDTTVNDKNLAQSREAFDIEKYPDLYASANLENEKSRSDKEKLTTLQTQARVYRNEGLQQQRAGNNLEAMGLYLKAVQLDPFYAVVYNDLGVVYEANGLLDRAEESYLKSTRIDPGYLSPYSNLASLYEAKRDLKNAAYYWKKRAQMGDPDDIWTQKARRRLEDLRLVLKDNNPGPSEENIIDLTKYVAIKKSIMRYDDHALARDYFDKAKTYFKKSDYVTALKYAVDALLLDPENKEIDEFVEKLQTRLLSK
ncbi:MAG: tetratricopeptide repeat protein [Candidatus Omnitrophica bacterium]|nr:tetratricopeptide repeat protein [Candidatus Omnitrophota bacterium]